jgi:ubiquinone/menaquinone biosynthesis C-methylase UbiE
MSNQNFQTFLAKFYLTAKGQRLLDEEVGLLNRSLSCLFGYYLVQIGKTTQVDLLIESRISYKVLVDKNFDTQYQYSFVQADIDYLPFKKESVDMVFIPHTLEAVADPYHLLRQIDKIILPEGALVISGFNPLGKKVISMMRFGEFKQQFKQAHFIKEARLIDWLNLLGYDIECINYEHTNKVFNKFDLRFFREKLFAGLRKIGFEFGNVYVIVARKRKESSTPIGLNWKLSNWLPVKKRQVAVNNSSHRKEK